MKYEYWKSTNDDQWHWHLKARNGEVIAQSEAYTTKAMCLKGIQACKRSLFAKTVAI